MTAERTASPLMIESYDKPKRLLSALPCHKAKGRSASTLRIRTAAEQPRPQAGKKTLLVLFALFAMLPGCSLCEYGKRTLLDEPSKFWWKSDRRESIEIYREWAHQAWCQQCGAMPEMQTSSVYVKGFMDGFVDYVYAGGTGEPPPVAPREFWNVDARNPHGHRAAADWFAGYRHGAGVARDEGYRQRATLQSSLPAMGPSDDLFTEEPLQPPHPAYVPNPTPAETVLPGQEALPEPSDHRLKEAEEPSTVETPLKITPNLEMPSVEEVPPLEEKPEAEPTPLKTPAPEESLSPEPSEEESTTPDVEELFRSPDLFGSSSGKRSSRSRRVPSKTRKTPAIRQTSATRKIRSTRKANTRSVDSNPPSLREIWNTLPARQISRSERIASAEKPTAYDRPAPAQSEPAKQYTELPSSDSDAKEMFHRLSTAQGKP